MGVGNLLPLAVDMKESASRVKHRTARHTYRAARSSRNVRMSKGCASGHQRIQVRSLDLIVPKRMDCVETLIVGEEEQDIRFSLHIRYFKCRP